MKLPATLPAAFLFLSLSSILKIASSNIVAEANATKKETWVNVGFTIKNVKLADLDLSAEVTEAIVPSLARRLAPVDTNHSGLYGSNASDSSSVRGSLCPNGFISRSINGETKCFPECPVGFFMSAESKCVPCSNGPGNMTYVGGGGLENTCAWTCAKGFFHQEDPHGNEFCTSCKGFCKVGEYSFGCGGSLTGVCGPCSQGPWFSVYTGDGGEEDNCPWRCRVNWPFPTNHCVLAFFVNRVFIVILVICCFTTSFALVKYYIAKATNEERPQQRNVSDRQRPSTIFELPSVFTACHDFCNEGHEYRSVSREVVLKDPSRNSRDDPEYLPKLPLPGKTPPGDHAKNPLLPAHMYTESHLATQPLSSSEKLPDTALPLLTAKKERSETRRLFSNLADLPPVTGPLGGVNPAEIVAMERLASPKKVKGKHDYEFASPEKTTSEAMASSAAAALVASPERRKASEIQDEALE